MVKMIGNSAGMICPPLAPSSQSHIPARSLLQGAQFPRSSSLLPVAHARVLHLYVPFPQTPGVIAESGNIRLGRFL
jgi:hypothetical protein